MASGIAEWYAAKRQRVAQAIDAGTLASRDDLVVSPSGLYQLEILHYEIAPGKWQYSRGLVTRMSDGTLLADIKRNYTHFPYVWLHHMNGSEYLICAEDYQGYTIVDLTGAVTQSYIPPEAKEGNGFCWVEVYPSPDGRTLAVDGCIWGAPYEIEFYDFSDPATLPLAKLWRTDAEDPLALGWEDTETFAMRYNGEIVRWRRPN